MESNCLPLDNMIEINIGYHMNESKLKMFGRAPVFPKKHMCEIKTCEDNVRKC